MDHSGDNEIRIPVTRPFLPPKQEYDALLRDVWNLNWLTNNGPMVQELERELAGYLDVDHILLVSNGTTALQITIKALDLRGEIITTPFSYVATTSSIVWEGCRPVFVDIDPATLNIDPAKIEEAITKDTSAILATHVYGNPCDIESIRTIADRHNLKIIFDAAHCFGTKYKGRSVYNFGDISAASFHATKPFHTVEGGAIITGDPDLVKKIGLIRNFGHNGPYRFSGVGINGKMSEFHAIMGLVNLRHADNILSRRKELTSIYDNSLKDAPISKPSITENTDYNYAYYAVIFESETVLLRVMNKLEAAGIGTRRYFYPSLDTLEYVTNSRNLTHTADISRRILCLPLYHELDQRDILEIAEIVTDSAG